MMNNAKIKKKISGFFIEGVEFSDIIAVFRLCFLTALFLVKEIYLLCYGQDSHQMKPENI